jgi:hypothetical protein
MRETQQMGVFQQPVSRKLGRSTPETFTSKELKRCVYYKPYFAMDDPDCKFISWQKITAGQ